MPTYLKGLSLGLIVGLLGVALSAMPLGLELEEGLGLWWLFKVRGPKPAPPEVVVVAIDRQAAQNLNVSSMPREWPRLLHAQLTEKLTQAGAAVIVFDLMFDRGNANTGHDASLAAAIQQARNVVLVDSLSKDVLPLAVEQNVPMGNHSVEKQAPPIPILASAAAAHAPFLLPKATRVNEYWTFKSGAGDRPTMPVVAFQVYALHAYPEFIGLWHKLAPQQARLLPATSDEMTAGRLLVELMQRLRDALSSDPHLAGQLLQELRSTSDEQIAPSKKRIIASLLDLYSGEETRYLNFYGPPRSIKTIRYDEALGAGSGPSQKRPGADEFKGKAVFVGFSAATQPEQDRIRDDYYTVFSEANGLNLSGVEIAATAFANLLEDRPIRAIAAQMSLGIVLLWGVAAGAICRSFRVAAGAALIIVLMLAYLAAAQYQFQAESVWVPLVVPLCIQAPLAFFGAVLLQYREARREREVIKRLFGHFLPPAAVDKLARNMGPITSANQAVFGACLASDAEHYTTLAEKMDAKRLSMLMNEYYAALFEPVERRGGIVSDVIGDAMLAIWAASSTESSLRSQACHAALEIAATMRQFNQVSDRPALPTRIGLHSGQILLGSIGAAHHYEYRAVGDIVNTATRIEGLGKHLGVRLTVSEDVLEGLDEFLARPLGRFVLAGKSTPVRIFELVGLKKDADKQQLRLCSEFDAALDAYANQRWHAAAEEFSQILEAFPGDGPARFYLKWSERFVAKPPDEPWDCAVHMESK